MKLIPSIRFENPLNHQLKFKVDSELSTLSWSLLIRSVPCVVYGSGTKTFNKQTVTLMSHQVPPAYRLSPLPSSLLTLTSSHISDDLCMSGTILQFKIRSTLLFHLISKYPYPHCARLIVFLF